MSEPVFLSEITVKLVQQCGGDESIAAAAKVLEPEAYRKYQLQCELANDSPAGLINYMMKHRHGTPFEHSFATFYVHAPIFVFREWHRHRIGFSYNESSARYREMEPKFWLPRPGRNMVPTAKHKPARPDFGPASDNQLKVLYPLMTGAYQLAWDSYQRMVENGIALEVARSVLPVGIYSHCWVSCNPRSMMAFLSLRTHETEAAFVSYPQAEIEEAARQVEYMLEVYWPLTYAAFCNNGRVGP